MKTGKLITFEGPEKSGKSTQGLLLKEYLQGRGFETMLIREPGSTKIGEKIRGILLDRRNTAMALITETLLYMAARAQLIHEVIQPALKRGCIVLCDRFLDSTICYQGFGAGLDAAMIRKIGRWAASGIRPDLTLLLDFWQANAHLKKETKRDRIESRPPAFHLRVKRGYFMLAKSEPRRIKRVKVLADMRRTHETIVQIVEEVLY